MGQPSGRRIEELAERRRNDAVTYPEVGATRTALLPTGYRHDEYTCQIEAPKAFEVAKEGLLSWQAHIGVGARVIPAAFGASETVIVVLAIGPLCVLAPCRIVYVIDERQSFGFGYGSLPGHPEQGEEAFLLDQLGEMSVRFTIRAFSRPAALFVRATSPVSRIIQVRTTKGYVIALKRYVESR
jgi:uncharacterized protein (UPF0548 family)